MPDAVNALTLQFLEWVASGPRTYGEAMDAWRSTCPRLSIWEDAIDAGLIAFEKGQAGEMRRTGVVLTRRGRDLLQNHMADSKGRP
jgi:hypothetical protein